MSPALSARQPIRQKWFPGNSTIYVQLHRTAVLPDDLASVLSARTEAVEIAIPKEDLVVRLSVDEARWLWSALAAAIRQAT